MNRPVCIDDYRELARRRLPQVIFDYIDGGSYAEVTLAKNIADMQALTLRQRVMKDVSRIDLTTELFGQVLSMPFLLGPVGAAGLYARRGEGQAARAAVAAGTTACLSTVSICDIEEVNAAAGQPVWFQLYMIRDRPFMERLLHRAKAAGCPVLVFTVDLQTPGSRYRSARSSMGGTLPLAGQVREMLDALARPAWLWDVWLRGRPHNFGNVADAVAANSGWAGYMSWLAANFDPSITWDDITWIRQRWDRPIVVKGILDPGDARRAVDAGVDGIVVSNHGGRQLDGAPSSVAALPAIVEAVGASTTVLMDGGVRSGLDVVRAMALGAKGCLLGRAWAYALAARGGAGVAHALMLLRAEMEVAMALTGCTEASTISRDLLF